MNPPPRQGKGGAQRRVGGDGALLNMESSDRRIDAAIGAIGGLAGGLLGVGGGFVMVPLQVIWAKRTQHRATGTSLAAILPIGVVAAATYYFGRSSPQTDLPVAFFLALGGIVGAFLGSLAARRISDRVLSMVFAILLLAVGLKEVYDALVGAAPQLTGSNVPALAPWNYVVITAGGLVVGIASGLTGVGGGTLIVPFLGLGFGIGQRIAQGTSLVALLPTAAIGALTRHRSGDVDVRAAMWMGSAGVPAALAGSALALWLPQRVLGGLFGLFLLAAAARMWPRRRA
ncbi:MAG TPA: sulfite exporter TauE/SafE family protein [Candidatus Dormibacteraeota bacterium]